MFAKVVCGNTLKIPLPNESVQCVVTSPPYWGLRDYGCADQLGLEPTPEEYTANMVQVFREVWRVLRPDGTLWLNLGDSYAGYHGNSKCPDDKAPSNKPGYTENMRAGMSISKSKRIERGSGRWEGGNNPATGALKPKDLIGIPWRVAFALQADGWWLRSDIIWHKPNPMPESVTDRPTSAHEYLFLLSKSERYYYDHEAIKEPGTLSSQKRIDQASFYEQSGGDKDYGKNGNGNRSARKALENLAQRYRTDKQRGHSRRHAGFNERWDNMSREEQCSVMRNKRDVWKVATVPYAEAHFATFPPKLVEPCVLAGSAPGDLVLDPFAGTGTVGEVSIKHQRSFVGIELSLDYIGLAKKRLHCLPVTMF